MATVEFDIPGTPVAKGRPRFGNGHSYTPAKTRDYEAYMKLLAAQAMRGRQIFAGALTVRIVAWMPVPASWSHAKRKLALDGVVHPTTRPDADNISKLCLDALNAIVWRDDAQVVSLTVVKRYGAAPRLSIFCADYSRD